MSRHWVWMRSDVPPKCKLTPWQEQPLVAQADELIRTFYRPQFVRPGPADHRFNDVVFDTCLAEMRANPWFHF